MNLTYSHLGATLPIVDFLKVKCKLNGCEVDVAILGLRADATHCCPNHRKLDFKQKRAASIERRPWVNISTRSLKTLRSDTYGSERRLTTSGVLTTSDTTPDLVKAWAGKIHRPRRNK